MKKLLSFIAFVLLFNFSADSQVNPHAIGARLNGSNYGFGAELSYQHGLGDKNRLELDLGFANHSWYSYLSVSAMYHWVWNITGGLNWYAGPGVGASLFNGKGIYTSSFGVNIGGQIGMEYDFNTHDFPLLLSVDFRPMYNLIGHYSGFGYGSALGIRYTF